MRDLEEAGNIGYGIQHRVKLELNKSAYLS